MKVKCPNCSYAWETKSEHIFVSCPSCLRKVQIKEIEKQEKLEE